MKVTSAEFVASASAPQECPETGCPEFAFIGRSNVGKSSLINLLGGGRRDLARVSSMPGKTQLLNFFLLNQALCLVDLPGYGYAKVAKEQRLDFTRSVASYLEGREELAHVFVLIDSRLEPQPIDLDFIRWLSGTPAPFSLVFTKTDKLKNSQLEAQIGLFQRTLSALLPQEPRIFTTSSITLEGKNELLRFLASLADDRE
jgi:GTP-binding protein